VIFARTRITKRDFGVQGEYAFFARRFGSMGKMRLFDTISPFSCLICPDSTKAEYSALIMRMGPMSAIAWVR
jgi:hypothetical protein